MYQEWIILVNVARTIEQSNKNASIETRAKIVDRKIKKRKNHGIKAIQKTFLT